MENEIERDTNLQTLICIPWCYMTYYIEFENSFYYYFMIFKHRNYSWSLVVTRGHSCVLLDKIVQTYVITVELYIVWQRAPSRSLDSLIFYDNARNVQILKFIRQPDLILDMLLTSVITNPVMRGASVA
jgi:hypothetical protein